MRALAALLLVTTLTLLLPRVGRAAPAYGSFHAAIYARAYEVREMADLEWLRARFETMEGEIEARGGRSWTEYRLALLDEVARDVIVGPARKVNPQVKVIVKYPNWYDHFHGLGFNLETGEVLTGERVPEGRGWFRSPDAGRTVVKMPVEPHSYRALKRQ